MNKSLTVNKANFLTPADLCDRWNGIVGVKTLANWRWNRKGPPHIRVGGRILYKIDDITDYENNSVLRGG